MVFGVSRFFGDAISLFPRNSLSSRSLIKICNFSPTACTNSTPCVTSNRTARESH